MCVNTTPGRLCILKMKSIFSRRWLVILLLVFGIIAVAGIWARWRPAQRFVSRELGTDEFRVVTWNVGYFSPVKNKNVRDIDLKGIVETLKGLSANIVVLQELSSIKQAETIAHELGSDWKAHAVETGYHGQVLAILSNLPYKTVDIKEAGGRKIIGVSLGDGKRPGIYIVGVHSPHPGHGMTDTIKNIKGAVAIIEDSKEPIRIIAGDLNYNFDPDDNQSLYKEITKTVSDSTALIGETYYAHTRIDHIFHSPKDLKVVSEASGMVDLPIRLAKVPGFRDHRPIVVTYDLTSFSN